MPYLSTHILLVRGIPTHICRIRYYFCWVPVLYPMRGITNHVPWRIRSDVEQGFVYVSYKFFHRSYRVNQQRCQKNLWQRLGDDPSRTLYILFILVFGDTPLLHWGLTAPPAEKRKGAHIAWQSWSNPKRPMGTSPLCGSDWASLTREERQTGRKHSSEKTNSQSLLDSS